MMHDTKEGQTNHCPMCEDSGKKILELEQRVRVLTDGLEKLLIGEDFSLGYNERNHIAELLNQTPQQTAAQIERWHVEWLGKPFGYVDVADGRMPDFHFKNESKRHIGMLPVYTLPTTTPLPKEIYSPETDLDEALRRQ